MFNNIVYKTLSLITQVGISIMVPIFLLLIIGSFIKSKFNIDLVIIFLIIGVVVGIRNTVVLINNFLKQNNDTSNESELVKKHKKYVNEKQQSTKQ